jgi:hypothetical protein
MNEQKVEMSKSNPHSSLKTLKKEPDLDRVERKFKLRMIDKFYRMTHSSNKYSSEYLSKLGDVLKRKDKTYPM